jgi:hypothetical protein
VEPSKISAARPPGARHLHDPTLSTDALSTTIGMVSTRGSSSKRPSRPAPLWTRCERALILWDHLVLAQGQITVKPASLPFTEEFIDVGVASCLTPCAPRGLLPGSLGPVPRERGEP